ncbi:tectonic-1 isoform X2 [Astyanax mexicanus]|uniref:tectonic-1 isoform X2 n=1 Tax=Astyanax mexicanus TaxID=7994 RepID=UPI0020CB10E3|nr:tectonic-1 isoform X2 [Astyanax mexicanus]
MAALLRVLILAGLFCGFWAKSGGFNSSVLDQNRTRFGWDESDNVTEETGEENYTLAPVSMPAASPVEPSTAFPETEIPEPTAEPDLARAGTAALPLPLSGSLPAPVTRVSDLCPCDVQSDQCEVNCCCDPDCSQERPLFTRCSVQKVTGDPRLCTQDAALYSLRTTAEGFSAVQTSVQRQINPDVFCIQTANYEQGLSFVTPNTPTEQNFDYLFNQFVGFFFGGSGGKGSALQTPGQGNSPGYLYGDIMRTEDQAGQTDFFRLPASAGTANCLDSNPAAFLKDETSRCVRSFSLAQDCTTLPALSFQTYTSFRIFSGKDTEANVKYTVWYGEAGQIVRVSAAFVLGAVSNSMLPIQQNFQISFVQEAKSDAVLRSSGNPGYVQGLPLVAGWRTAEGIIRSTDPQGSLTVLQSSVEQDCLFGVPQRSPVLFGTDTLSGCTFRLEDGANCSLVSEVILGTLKGQSFPEYVATFGNSLPQNLMDWVPIENQTTVTSLQDCSIPLSYHLEVRWTKYGTLVNPQSQIVSVMEVITFNTSTLPSSSTGGLIPVSSSVSFIDVSASASPGYRAAPTINAKLPYDFFFPFV